MCALLRLVREIKVMYAEKMKMEILRREKNISTPPTRKSVDSSCQPGEKLIRLVLAGLWQLVSNLTDRRSLRAASHHSVFFLACQKKLSNQSRLTHHALNLLAIQTSLTPLNDHSLQPS